MPLAKNGEKGSSFEAVPFELSDLVFYETECFLNYVICFLLVF